jgi:hypothetical protein
LERYRSFHGRVAGVRGTRHTTMDPPNISVACVALLANIGSFPTHISKFVAEQRRTRKDMDAASRELLSIESSREQSVGSAEGLYSISTVVQMNSSACVTAILTCLLFFGRQAH